LRLVYDTEGDGLREECTVTWCIVAKDLDTGEIYKYEPDKIQSALVLLSLADTLICHNQIGYDLPVLKNLYGWEPEENQTIIDTLVLSRLLSPDRRVPKGWVGRPRPHSIEAWGMRLGKHKPEHEDWSRYTPEMLHRCTEDVLIQELVYKELLKEIG